MADMSGRDLSSDSDGRDVVFAEGSRGQEYMARSKTRKLLLCEDDAFSSFFDLELDPEETTNLIKDPAYQDIIKNLKDALSRWILFETRTPVHVDEEAELCGGENVVPGREEDRAAMAKYLREKIEPSLRSES